jgi:hypothetical protein
MTLGEIILMATTDNRNWWQRMMPRWLGGKDHPLSAFLLAGDRK